MRVLENIPAVAAVLAKYPNAKQSFVVCDSMAEYADLTYGHCNRYGGGDWNDGMTAEQSHRCLRDGDLSNVPAADKMLSEIEDSFHFETRAWRVIDDIVGAVPNVPAFIAGVPQNMRRRQRTTTERAPLSIIVDVTGSAQISGAVMRRRGCAILALVRLLVNVRPVELWAIVGLGKTNFAAEILTRIDTTPLDLARAAHMLSHPSVARALGFGYLDKVHNAGGGWNFSDIDLQRKTGAESYAKVVGFANEVLYLPPVYIKDDKIENPVAWLKTMLERHGGIEQAAA